MAGYKNYPAVEKVQSFLNDEMSKGTTTGEALEVDGEWGPKTTEAFWSWLGTQPEGSDLSTLVGLGVVDEGELGTLDQAWKEHTAIEVAAVADAGAPKAPTDLTIPTVVGPEKKGWSTLTYVVLGVVVAGAGLAGYYWVKSSRQKKLAAAQAGLGEFGEGEMASLGEGEMVSLGRPKVKRHPKKRAKKSLGCGCSG